MSKTSKTGDGMLGMLNVRWTENRAWPRKRGPWHPKRGQWHPPGDNHSNHPYRSTTVVATSARFRT